MNRLSHAEMLEVAAARARNAAMMEEAAENEGHAVKVVRAVFGVVGRRPGKKRAATSGCAKTAKRDHGRLSLIPVADVVKVIREPVVLTGGRTKDGLPFAKTMAVAVLSQKQIDRNLKKRDKMLDKIVNGK